KNSALDIGGAPIGGNTPAAGITRSVAVVTAKIAASPAATAPVLRSTPRGRRGGSKATLMGGCRGSGIIAISPGYGRRHRRLRPRVGAAPPSSTSPSIFFMLVGATWTRPSAGPLG